MKNYSLVQENDFCEDNHKNHFYDPSIDAYVCQMCDSISPANHLNNTTEDEYQNCIGI
ncbi:hypothetical protein ACYSNX_03555 [Myroides sp. LJL115]